MKSIKEFEGWFSKPIVKEAFEIYDTYKNSKEQWNMYKKVLCIIFLCLFLFNTNASGFLEITETGKQHNIEKIQTELHSIPCVIQSEIESSDEYDPDCLTFTIKITMSDNRYLEIENYYALTKYFNETRIKQINDLIPLKWVCGVIDKK